MTSRKGRITDWLTQRLGEPRVDVTGYIQTSATTSCVGVSCVTTPITRDFTKDELTWRTPKIRVYHVGVLFDFDLIPN